MLGGQLVGVNFDETFQRLKREETLARRVPSALFCAKRRPFPDSCLRQFFSEDVSGRFSHFQKRSRGKQQAILLGQCKPHLQKTLQLPPLPSAEKRRLLLKRFFQHDGFSQVGDCKTLSTQRLGGLSAQANTPQNPATGRPLKKTRR